MTNSEGQGRVAIPRHMGVIDASVIIIGQVIGTGIFLTPKGVTEAVRSPGVTLITWLLCGVENILAALMYAELGAMIPKAGGEYAFVYQTFGPVAAFTTLWCTAFLFVPCSFGIMGRTASSYILGAFVTERTLPDIAVTLVGLWIIVTIVTLNCLNVRVAAWIQKIFSAAKLLALGLISVTGIAIMARDGAGYLSPSEAFRNPRLDPASIATAIMVGNFAYGGWDNLNRVQEEVKDPGKNLPRAVWLGMLVVTSIYLLTNIAYFTVLSPEEIVASSAVALTFAQHTLPSVSWLIPLSVGVSAAGSLNGATMATSRIVFGAARDGKLPAVLSMISIRRLTPIPAIIALTVLGVVYMVFPDIYVLVTYMAVVSRLQIVLALASFFYLRWSKPHWPRPVRVHIALAVITVIIFIVQVLLFAIRDPITTLVAFVMYLSAVPVYYLGNYLAVRSDMLRVISVKVTEKVQKILLVVQEEQDQALVASRPTQIIQPAGNDVITYKC